MDEDEKYLEYFDRNVVLEIPVQDGNCHEVDKFNVYIAGSCHKNILLCLHGAGHTALSWSLLAKSLKHIFCVVAYDCRGHGRTECVDAWNFHTDILVKDALNVAKKSVEDPSPLCCVSKEELLVRKRILSQTRQDGIPMILMGHSMGGAMAIHLAFLNQLKNLQGLIVLDVVEGTALEALPSMDQFIKSFPPSFRSLQEGINWALCHVLNNAVSAAVSIPSQLMFDGKLWRWRVNLEKTKSYWREWFLGIDEKFLTASIPSGAKILILVGHERLDKPLTIAQMQGKFQLTVIPKSGHIVHEDQPEDIIRVLVLFAERYCLM